MENDGSLIHISQAVQVIKTAVLQSQIRTAKNVNSDVLALYYFVGGYISSESRKQQWGNGATKAISEQLQKELPGLKGFGDRNLRNMRQFYDEWNKVVFWQPMAAKNSNGIIWQPLAAEIGSSVATQLQISTLQLDFQSNTFDIETAHDFLSISFTHHMEILNKTDTLEERLFYIRHTAAYKWDKYRLRDLLKQDLYHHQSAMPNNFLQTLPKRVQALKAIEMFKDEYFLDYVNVEELGVRDEADIDEKVVENAIVQNVKNFIMTFGKDFTFVGNQYHLEKFGENEFIDLLFYNRELACLVAVELKKGKFKPAYLGQLQSYLQILDTDIRKKNENPSIGIILCREMNKAYVEFVIQKYDSPMGVATYKTSDDMPENLRKALPDIEDLKRLLSNDIN